VLTLEALAKHALKPAQRLKLETEARTGEFKIEEAKKESERELQRLLGKPSTVPMSALSHPPLSTSATVSPLPLQSSHTSSRIERASYRDPVGEQVVATTSTKCTYLGIIVVTRRQFQEAGTTCVECPILSRTPYPHIPQRSASLPIASETLNPSAKRGTALDRAGTDLETGRRLSTSGGCMV